MSNEEKDCTDFLVKGKCPPERWATEACPLNVIEGGYVLCCTERLRASVLDENSKDEA